MHDLYNDTAHAYIRFLANKYPGVQPLLKVAEFEDSREEIPKTAFAWPGRGLFPVHTPAHAVVSALYAHEQGAPAFVQEKIAEALAAYGVPDEVFAREVEKVASSETLFEDGTYPVGSPDEVLHAQARLLSQADRLPLDQRVEVFHKLAMAATSVGVDLHPISQAWGLAAYSNPQKVMEGLEARAQLAKTAEIKQTYRELADSLQEKPLQLRDYDTRVKLASTLMDLDKVAEITSHYDRRIPDPLCTVFNTHVKLGAQVVNLGTDAYDLSSLVALPTSFYADTLGPEILSEIAPGGQINPEAVEAILPTLPADMLKHFQQGLASAGVAPLGI